MIMEDLIKELQEKAGLTRDQAIRAIEVVKDYMKNSDAEIDWEKFFKEKLEDLREKVKTTTSKIVDAVDDIADQARNIFREN